MRVKIEETGHAAICTLSQPEKRNPISSEMRRDLMAALESVRTKDSVRAVIITGSGSAFCSGLDLEALAEQQKFSTAEHVRDSKEIADFFQYVYSYPKATIAAVNGPAVAGGCGLAIVCDMTIASETAWFALSEVKIGFVPAIVSVFLERTIGPKRAKEMTLTGRKVDANEAKSWGIVNEVLPAAELMHRATALADQIAQNSPSAVTETKRVAVCISRLCFEEAINIAVDSNAKTRATPQCKEGVEAFLTKRKPTWAD
jgi:methylglutaconyl-CoA hydratase